MDPRKIILLFMLCNVLIQLVRCPFMHQTHRPSKYPLQASARGQAHDARAGTSRLQRAANSKTIGDLIVQIEQKRKNIKVCTGIHVSKTWILTLSDCIKKKLKPTEYIIIYKDGSKQKVIAEERSSRQTFSLLKIEDNGKTNLKFAQLSDSTSTPSKDDFYIYNTNKKGEVKNAKVDFVSDDKCEKRGVIGISGKGNKCFQVKEDKETKRKPGRPVFRLKNNDVILQGLAITSSASCTSTFQSMISIQPHLAWINTIMTDCGSVPKIKDGTAILDKKSKTTVGGTASIKCDSGYRADKQTIVCKKTGEWEESSCEEIELQNGKVTLDKQSTSTLGATASVTCKSGYIADRERVICLKTGQWENATCTLKDCGSVQNIEKGEISLDTSKSTVGATASIKCKSGFEADKKKIACSETGEWEEATCKAKECGSSLSLPNGVLTFGTTTVGSIASVTCNSGYLPKKDYIECLPSGSWETPRCVIKDCGSVKNIEKGQITLDKSKSTVGATASIKCKSGYEANKKKIACLETGKWEEATCKPKDCGSSLTLPNGTLTFGTSTVGSIASVTCNSGYLPKKDYIECLTSGSWETPLCEDVNDCNIDTCLNNGTCTDGINNYTCKCSGGFSGRNCELAPLPPTCSSNVCESSAASCSSSSLCYVQDEDEVIAGKYSLDTIDVQREIVTPEECRVLCLSFSSPPCVAYGHHPVSDQCLLHSITPSDGLVLKDNGAMTLFLLTCARC